jgi:hypothetical protein
MPTKESPFASLGEETLAPFRVDRSEERERDKERMRETERDRERVRERMRGGRPVFHANNFKDLR